MHFKATLVVVSLVVLPSVALAQGDDPVDPTVAEAREQFELGEAAFAEDDYPVALDHFRRAYELAPHDGVRFNVAVCLERLGRYREAAAEYEQAMRSDALSQEQRDRAARLMVRSQDRLGTLVVTSEPSGRSVDIDDGSLECSTPCELEMDAGAHTVSADGPEGPVVREATVSRGETTELELDLRPPEVPDETPPARIVTESRGVGALTWIGLGLVAAGGGAFAGLGLHTLSLHDDYVAAPNAELRDEGLLFRTLTWAVGVGTAAVGLVLVLIDLAILAPQEIERPVALGPDGLRVAF